jgi:hypothetical protein
MQKYFDCEGLWRRLRDEFTDTECDEGERPDKEAQVHGHLRDACHGTSQFVKRISESSSFRQGPHDCLGASGGESCLDCRPTPNLHSRHCLILPIFSSYIILYQDFAFLVIAVSSNLDYISLSSSKEKYHPIQFV